MIPVAQALVDEIDRLLTAEKKPRRMTLRAACWLWFFERGQHEEALAVLGTEEKP